MRLWRRRGNSGGGHGYYPDMAAIAAALAVFCGFLFLPPPFFFISWRFHRLEAPSATSASTPGRLGLITRSARAVAGLKNVGNVCKAPSVVVDGLCVVASVSRIVKRPREPANFCVFLVSLFGGGIPCGATRAAQGAS